MADNTRTLDELNAIVCALEETYPLAGIKAKLNEICEQFDGLTEPDLSVVTDKLTEIEEEIAELMTTILGLSQVQSDLSALAATVNSLQTGLSSQIDTALADGLADVDASISAIEAAVADVASADDLALIADAIDANQEALDELLAESAVYHGNVVINTPATLEFFHGIGNGLCIVNGDVDIDVTAEMDLVKVQETVDSIKLAQDFAYTAGTGVDTEITFNNLVAAQNLTIDQEGGYSFRSLKSATVITFDDDSSVARVDLRSLVSVTSLKNGPAALPGTFVFSSANELHLTSLPRSPHTALSLGVDTGGVIDISALRDVDFRGRATKLNLTVSGAASFTSANLSGDKAGSTMTFNNVETVTLQNYDGLVTIEEEVKNFTSDGLVDWIVSGNDLVTVNVTGILSPNTTTADLVGPSVNLSGQGDLETVSLFGTLNTVVLSSNGNLESVIISADVTGPAGIDISSNSDLVAISLTGTRTDKIDIDGNSDLETLTIDSTTARGQATTQEGTIIVNNNEELQSLIISTNNVDNLTITNNVKLETIDLTGLTAIGATGTPSVTISDNNLIASLSRDLSDTPFDVADGAPNDLGIFVTTSGLDTAKSYLTAVSADADSRADVKFDLVSSVIDAEGATPVETATDAVDISVLTLIHADPSTTPPTFAVSFNRVSWL